MIDFYAEVRADDVSQDGVGDMLFFSWGTYDWGNGPAFEYEIRRQLSAEAEDPADADDAILQLELTFHFDPSPETEQLGNGAAMCANPAGVHELRTRVAAEPATAYAQRSSVSRLEFVFDSDG